MPHVPKLRSSIPKNPGYATTLNSSKYLVQQKNFIMLEDFTDHTNYVKNNKKIACTFRHMANHCIIQMTCGTFNAPIDINLQDYLSKTKTEETK
jgi:hypothetical protein